MFAFHLARAGVLVASVVLSHAAAASEQQRAESRSAAASIAAPSAHAQSPAAGLGRPAQPELLERARGGATHLNHTTLGGSVSGNSATQVVTGANIIQSGSFAGMSGIPIVVQNSGANVLIQNATVINLQLK